MQIEVGQEIYLTLSSSEAMLLLLEGEARIENHSNPSIAGQSIRLHPGQILDELEVLTHSNSESTIVADTEKTRILAIPVDALDDLLDEDPDFAHRILELESRRLQQLVKAGATLT